MKDVLLKIIQEYLLLFPNEIKRQEALINFLNKFNDEEIIIVNNKKGRKSLWL